MRGDAEQRKWNQQATRGVVGRQSEVRRGSDEHCEHAVNVQTSAGMKIVHCSGTAKARQCDGRLSRRLRQRPEMCPRRV